MCVENDSIRDIVQFLSQEQKNRRMSLHINVMRDYIALPERDFFPTNCISALKRRTSRVACHFRFVIPSLYLKMYWKSGENPFEGVERRRGWRTTGTNENGTNPRRNETHASRFRNSTKHPYLFAVYPYFP